MRASLVVATLGIIVVFGWFLYTRTVFLKNAIAEQQKQLHDLEEKVALRTRADNLDMQERCSKQARQEFTSMGYKANEVASYTNHYNTTLNKCFILVESANTKLDPGTIWMYKYLFDAYEGKEYGTYSWHSDKAKKYWEVPPFECKGTLASGDEKICRSSDEFNEIAKLYMQ